jgi:hypothetical protein
LECSPKKSFAFKIIEANNYNGIAVGVCEKNIIVSNNYEFDYSKIGHGSYMISSSGKCYDSLDSNLNN